MILSRVYRRIYHLSNARLYFQNHFLQITLVLLLIRSQTTTAICAFYRWVLMLYSPILLCCCLFAHHSNWCVLSCPVCSKTHVLLAWVPQSDITSQNMRRCQQLSYSIRRRKKVQKPRPQRRKAPAQILDLPNIMHSTDCTQQFDRHLRDFI
jgi:hypothetical protein